MKPLERLLFALVHGSDRSPRLVLVIAFFAVLILGFFAAQIPEAISIHDQLDPTREESIRLVDYRREFRDVGALGFLLETEATDLLSLCRFEFDLSAMLLDIPVVRSHMSPLRLQRVTHDGDRFEIESSRDQCESESPRVDLGQIATPATRTFFEGAGGKSWLYLFQLQETPDSARVTDWLPDLQDRVSRLLPGA
ncbi:MAG: hypothetical protein AAB250_11365, partial [Bdellovibrionota bacterium]